MIFRLKIVPALDLPQDAVFLFFFFEEAPQVETHRKEVYRKEVLLVGCFANFADFFAAFAIKSLTAKVAKKSAEFAKNFHSSHPYQTRQAFSRTMACPTLHPHAC